jgi:hypothetical protein
MNEIVLTQRLKDDYQTLPDSVQKKLKKQIRFLAENPKHRSLQIHRVQGTAIGSFTLTNRIVAFFGKRVQPISCWRPDLTRF